MVLIRLGRIDSAEEIIGNAFRRGAETRKAALPGLRGKSRQQKSKSAESSRLSAAAKSLKKQLSAIVEGFPSFNQLPPFYAELVRTMVDMDDVRNALGAVQWAHDLISRLSQEHMRRLAAVKEPAEYTAVRSAFYGRCAGTLRRIDKWLALLERTRKALRELPTVKTSIPTVVIAGMPNVGKSTLLKSLTTAKPEIQHYPFTTKHLMLGYAEIDGKQVQFIDTPGLLERERKNEIERRAVLAIKHLAKAVIVVIDPTLQSGYSIEEQKRLLQRVKDEFNTPVIVVISKADLAGKEEIKEAGEGILIAAKIGEGIDELRKELAAILVETVLE